jgi:G6PDH family F420-dependent oxidoreductase
MTVVERTRPGKDTPMTMIGYTMMCEQAGPKQLVRDVVLAEEAGFDFAVISDHYFPWLDSQGHSPYAWSVLGAAAQATDRIPLMTYVTCPIRRYHPAVVAQKAATMQLLSDGRFSLGLGAGENLNEHIVGGGWPIATARHEMLGEAVEIIRALWTGATVTFRGNHFDVESAKIWDLPDTAPPIGIAVSGPSSCRLAGQHADMMIAVEPRAELGQMFDDAGGSTKPRVGQIALSYDPDQGAALDRAMGQFRWFTGGWRVNAELPLPASFDQASRTVSEEDVLEKMPCGPDLEKHVAGIRQFESAGFTHVALIQVGADTQEQFMAWAATELLPALRAS